MGKRKGGKCLAKPLSLGKPLSPRPGPPKETDRQTPTQTETDTDRQTVTDRLKDKESKRQTR